MVSASQGSASGERTSPATGNEESFNLTREDPSSRVSFRIDSVEEDSGTCGIVLNKRRNALGLSSRARFPESTSNSESLDYRIKSIENCPSQGSEVQEDYRSRLGISESSLEDSTGFFSFDSIPSISNEEDEGISRLSSPKRELCGSCDHYRSRCICSSEEDNLDSSLHYCQWKIQLEQPFEERSHIEDIPEAISGNFAPSWCPKYTNKKVVALQYTRQRLLQVKSLDTSFEESCRIE